MLLKLKKNKKGFTLIELIVVVAILAILAAIAVPNFINLTAEAQEKVNISNAAAIAGAVNVNNALPDTTQIPTVEGITEDALGDLWPQGITKITEAKDLITFKNGVCVLK